MSKDIKEQQCQHYEAKLAFEIDSWDLWDGLRQDRTIIVVDTRGPEAYAKERIPGAISLPHRTMDRANTAHLVPDALYVCYCDGIGCNASTKGALNLNRLGFKVRELMGGLDWWKRDGYQTLGEAGRPGTPIVCGC